MQNQTLSIFRSHHLNWPARVALATLSWAVLIAAPAHAQSADAPSEETSVIIVTGVAKPTAQAETGVSTTVITLDALEAGGQAYVGDALRQTPGIAITRVGPFGGLTQARIRGAEGNHTLVLLDGVDVSPAGTGETDLSTLLTGNVQRIEIVRGAQSGLYGSNALAGVINVITERDLDRPTVFASIEGGSFNTGQIILDAGLGDGESSLSAGLVYRTTSGFDASVRGANAGPASLEGDREGDRNTTYYLQGARAFAGALQVRGFARYVEKSSEFDGFDFSGVPEFQGLPFDDPSRSKTFDLNFGGSATLTLADGRSVSRFAVGSTDSETQGGFFGDVSSRRTANLRSAYTFGPQAFVSTITGFVDYKEETYRNTTPFSPEQIPEQSRSLTGIGVDYRAAIRGQVFLSAVVRHDDNDAFEDADTYGLSAAWRIPDTGLRLHSSAGSGVANPSFFEQFGFDPGSFAGNPNLKPERGDSWDIGIESTFWNGKAVADVTWFQSRLEDEITFFFDLNTFLSSYRNASGASDRQGLEGSLLLRPTDALDFTATITSLDASDASGAAEVLRPELQGAIDLNWRAPDGRTRLNAGVLHTGDRFDNDFRAAPALIGLDPYTLLRVGASYQLTPRIELFGRIENLADDDYVESFGYRTPGRAAYVGLRIREPATGGRAR